MKARLAAQVSIKLALLALAFSLGACGGRRNSSTQASGQPTPIPAAYATTTNDGGTGMVVSYADVVSRVAPAVVTIHSQMRVRAPQQFPFTDDMAYRDFFGDRGDVRGQPVQQRRTALGSGVIVSADGYILT
ncbi:MAG TPA: hypothetical protein VGO69_01255, partial [Pyrinomonadaceae bacterium]|nr:hypothetical protein [Pyrinomonadaceae bacterium]